MGGGDVGGDGEAEAGAAAVAGAALVEAHEPLARRRPRRAAGMPGPSSSTSTRTSSPARSRPRRARPTSAWRAALATRWSTARPTAVRRPTTGSTSSTDGDLDRHPPRRARRRRDATSAIENGVARERPLVAAGQQQEVVDEALQPVELAEQHVAGRVPVVGRSRAGRPPARRASRRPACAARARRRRRAGGSSSTPSRAGRASRSSSTPARRSRRPTPAPAPARAATASRSRRRATSRRGPDAAPARRAATPARRRARRAPARPPQQPRVVAIVSRTESSGDAVASVNSPADGRDTCSRRGRRRCRARRLGHRHACRRR